MPLSKAARLSDVLRPVLSSLAAQHSLRKTTSGILEAACAATSADAAAITIATRSGELRILAVAGAPSPEQRTFPLEGSLSGRVIEAGGLIVAGDLRSEEAWSAKSLPGFRSAAGVPVEARDRILGTLVVARRRAGRWPQRIGPTLVPLARCASVALQQQQLRRYVRSHLFALLGGRRGDGRRPRLSPREQAIAELLVEGRSCKEVGVALEMSARTVQHHVDRMKVRFNRNTLHGLAARLVDALR